MSGPKARIAFLLAALLGVSRPGFAEFTVAGRVTAMTALPQGAEFAVEPGAKLRIEAVRPGVFRIRFAPDGRFDTGTSPALARRPYKPPSVQVYDTPDTAYLKTAKLAVTVGKNPLQVAVVRPNGRVVNADAPQGWLWDPDTGQVVTRKFAPKDEHYLGLGERGGPVDRRGRAIYLRNSDFGGYGPLTDPLYASFPFFYGFSGGAAYGLFFDNPATPFFDFDAAGTGLLSFGAEQGTLDYYVIDGPSPRQVALSYAALTGPAPLPPLWSLGYLQSRYSYRSAAELDGLAKTFRRLDIPCDGFFLDLDYMDRLQYLTFNPATFPDPAGMIRSLDGAGFKLVNIVEPALLDHDQLWGRFDSGGFFLKGPDGQSLADEIFLGRVSWIDFTQPAARVFVKRQLKAFLANGLAGVWNDLNEPAQNFMPEAIYDFGGNPRGDVAARDLYALYETSLTHEALTESHPGQRPWVLSRSGYAGIQRYAALWGGDSNSDFASLATAVQMSLGMGLSGVQQFGHDVGGFLGSPTAELFIRWLEFGAYSPFLRNHAINTSPPREPWRFGQPYTRLARRIIEARYRLLPYLYSLFDQAREDGTPVIAPTAFHFPDDPETYAQDDAFMLGADLLVAPVLAAGAATKAVHLPKGADWVELTTGASYAGGQTVTVAAPLERIPVFARRGAPIVRAALRQHVREAVAPDLEIEIPSAGNGRFVLYEDDGQSLAYAQGVYLRTALETAGTGSARTLTVRRLGGHYQPPARAWNVRFEAVPAKPGAVELDGVPLPEAGTAAALASLPQGWHYNSRAKLVMARFQDRAAPVGLRSRP